MKDAGAAEAARVSIGHAVIAASSREISLARLSIKKRPGGSIDRGTFRSRGGNIIIGDRVAARSRGVTGARLVLVILVPYIYDILNAVCSMND